MTPTSEQQGGPAVVTIDEDDAIHGLRKVVEKQGPDTIYRIPPEVGHCVYVERGACSCLISHVLVYLGVPIGALEYWNDATIDCITLPGVSITDKAVVVLKAGQDAQDVGESWGQALEDAEDAYRRVTS